MIVYVLKFKYESKETPQIIGVFSELAVLRNFIDGNKYKEVFQNGEWIFSDHDVDNPR